MGNLNREFTLTLTGAAVASVLAALEYAGRSESVISAMMQETHNRIVDQMNSQLAANQRNS